MTYLFEVATSVGFTGVMKTLADYSNLLKQLHPDKNGDVNPANYGTGSNKKLWWKCDVAEDHVWETRITARIRGSRVPILRRKTRINN